MRKVDLYSQEWCNQVFSDRNKDYGAYQLRATIGRRYARALTILFVGMILFVGLPVGVHLYLKYNLYKSAKDFEKEIPKLAQLDAKPEHEIKIISGGRSRPTISTDKDATEQIGEIVEATDHDIIIGVKGKETFNAEEWISEWEDLDTEHNIDDIDLPVEGPQLVQVDQVEEMPVFPGGIKALMTWLGENIPYPKTCMDRKVRGLMEVRFVVDENGFPHEFCVVKSLHPDLDKLVLSAMRRMPMWKPGKSQGSPCKVAVTLPLHFEPK